MDNFVQVRSGLAQKHKKKEPQRQVIIKTNQLRKVSAFLPQKFDHRDKKKPKKTGKATIKASLTVLFKLLA